MTLHLQKKVFKNSQRRAKPEYHKVTVKLTYNYTYTIKKRRKTFMVINFTPIDVQNTHRKTHVKTRSCKRIQDK